MSRINGVIGGVVRSPIRGLTSNKGVGVRLLLSRVDNLPLISRVDNLPLTARSS